MNSLTDMRPLMHPGIEEVTAEGILYALSDPVRAAIFAGVTAEECAESCSIFLKIGTKAVPKSTLSQHFRILRENGLVRGERHGVEMRHTSRCAELEGRFPGLLRAVLNAYAVQSAEKKQVRKKVKSRQ